MHAKGRHIDLRNSGRKLNAPPEGYGPKREAQVKQWLARLPEDVAEADEVQSIHVRVNRTCAERCRWRQARAACGPLAAYHFLQGSKLATEIYMDVSFQGLCIRHLLQLQEAQTPTLVASRGK